MRPDLTLEVRADLLDEEDGPTLVHGIQALHDARIRVPTRREDRPSQRRLETRYEEFLEEARKVS